MELPHMGKPCEVCNRNDYLPFKCAHCSKIVCIDHKANHGSDCPLEQTNFEFQTEEGYILESLKKSCDYCRKITLKLELTECPACGHSHCLYHRHQVNHDCSHLAKVKEEHAKEFEERFKREREALNRLKNLTKTSVNSTPVTFAVKQPITDPKKRALAKRIRIMKLKQTAKGPPNILDQDKIYLEATFLHQPSSSISKESLNNKSIRMFTSRKHTVGRMIDWTADELSLVNRNDKSNETQLIFVKQSDSGTNIELENCASFAKYLDCDTLEDGDELIITYKIES